MARPLRPDLTEDAMCRLLAAAGLTAAVLLPTNGNAQVYLLPTPVPQVTAARASWQVNGEAVFYAGAFYYPAGPTVYFDGNVMVRVGTYRTVPLYVDATLEPYSMVYVPVGGRVMRPYERPRAGDLAGTTGSRTPSFPVQSDAELSAAIGGTGLVTPALPNVTEPAVIPEANAPVGAVRPPVLTPVAPAAAPTAQSSAASPQSAASQSATPTGVLSIPPPSSNIGVWIPYGGEQWRLAGEAVVFSPDRFTPVGEYHGFPVYRAMNGSPDEIYVPAVPDGALTPYRR
jgi:hypothetical protein